MTRILCALLFVVSTSLSAAQDFGDLIGTVQSDQHERLRGAQIAIKGLKLGDVVNQYGQFHIRNIPVGTQEVTASMTGYESQTKTITIVRNDTLILNFTLKSKTINLEPLQVEGKVPERAVTATMVEMELVKIPAAVEVITEKEIEEKGALTVADALQESQSLYLQGDSERALAASLRGLRTKYTLVLVDGRRVAPGLRENIDLDDLPTSMIDRIEVVRGPTSSLYGSDAIGGVNNIITKEPTEIMTAGMAIRYGSSVYGQAQSPFIKGYMAEKNGGLGYSLAASYDRQGQYDRYKQTVWTDGDKKKLRSASAKFSLDLTPNQIVHFGLDKSRVARKGVRPYDWGDGNRLNTAFRKSIFFDYQGNFRENSNLLIQAYEYRYQTQIGVSPLILGNVTNPLSQTSAPYHLSQNLRQAEARWSQSIFSSHTATLGVEYRKERRYDDKKLVNVENDAVFFQDVYQVIDPLLVVFGARYDKHTDFGTAFSPKVSTTYSPLEHLRFKGSYGKGIRAPSIFELYIDSPSKESLVQPNLELKPEESKSYEFGVGGEYSSLSGEVRYFRNDLKDMINTVEIGSDTLYQIRNGAIDHSVAPWIRPVLQYMNIARALTKGFEINASVKLPRHLELSADASLMTTEDKTTGAKLLNIPEVLNNIKLEYNNLDRGLRANIRLTTVGKRKISDLYDADGYTFLNLYCSKKLSTSTEVYLGANNVLNSDPNLFGYLEGAGSMGAYIFGGINIEFREFNPQ